MYLACHCLALTQMGSLTSKRCSVLTFYTLDFHPIFSPRFSKNFTDFGLMYKFKVGHRFMDLLERRNFLCIELPALLWYIACPYAVHTFWWKFGCIPSGHGQIWQIPHGPLWPDWGLYKSCGSQNFRQFVHRVAVFTANSDRQWWSWSPWEQNGIFAVIS